MPDQAEAGQGPVRIRIRLDLAVVMASFCLGLVLAAAGLYASHSNPVKIYPAGLCSVDQGLGCPAESGRLWSVHLVSLSWRNALASTTPDSKWVWNKKFSSPIVSFHPSGNLASTTGWLFSQGGADATALDTHDADTSLASSTAQNDKLFLAIDDTSADLATHPITMVSVVVLASTRQTSGNTGYWVGIQTGTGLNSLNSLDTKGPVVNRYVRQAVGWSDAPTGTDWTAADLDGAQILISHNDATKLFVTEAYLHVYYGDPGQGMFMVSFDFSGQVPATQALVSTDAIDTIQLFATVGGSPTYNAGTNRNDNTFKIGLGLYSGGTLQSTFYTSPCTGADTPSCAPDKSFRLASVKGSPYQTPTIATNFVTGKAWLYSELRSVVAIIQQTDNLGSLLSVEQLRMDVTAFHPLTLSLTTDAPYFSTRGVDPLTGGLQSYFYRVIVQHAAGALVSRVRVCLNKNPCGAASDPGWVTMARDAGAGQADVRDGDFSNGEQFLVSYNGFATANLNSTQTYYFEAEDPAGRTGRFPIPLALSSVLFGPALLVSYASVQIHPLDRAFPLPLVSLWSFCGEPDCTTDQGTTAGNATLYSTALDLNDGDEAYAWTTGNAAILSMNLESAGGGARNFFKISGVQVRAVARDEETLTSFRLGFRIGAANYLASAPTTDTAAAWSDYAGTLYSLNPATNTAWTWTDLDSLIVLVSHKGTSALRVTELTADVYLGSIIHPATINALSSTGNCCAFPTPAGTSWEAALAVHDGDVRYVTVGGSGALESILYLALQAPAAAVAGPYISYVQVGVVADVTTLFSFRFGVRSNSKDVTEEVEDREQGSYKTYLTQRYEVDPATNRPWTWDDIRRLQIVIAPPASSTPSLRVTEAYLLIQDSPIRLGFAGESGLTADGVDPNTGSTTTRFTFKTLYTSTNNVAPNTALFSVIIDGGTLVSSFTVAHPLVSSTKDDGNFANGELYSASVTGAQLGQGTHNYYFLVSDLGSPSSSGRLPASGVFDGPSVDTGSSYLTLWPLKSWEGSTSSSLNWRFIGLESTALDTFDDDATLASTTGTSLQSLSMKMDSPPGTLSSETISFVMVNAVARDNLGSITTFNLGLCSVNCATPGLRSFDLGHRTPGDGLYHLYTSPPFTALVSSTVKKWTWDAIASLVTIIERPANWPPLYVTELYATVGLTPVLHPSGPAATDPGTWGFRGNSAVALDKNDGNSSYASHVVGTANTATLYMDFDDPTQSGFLIEGVQLTVQAAPLNNSNPPTAALGQRLAVGFQIGGTDYMELASVMRNQTGYWPYTTVLYQKNPGTGLAWTWDDIKDLVGAVIHTGTQVRVTEMNLVVLYSPIQLSLPSASDASLVSFKTDAVDPDSGASLTSFMYKVVYTNINNAAPKLISLRVDGGITLSSLYSLSRDSSATGALGDGTFTNGELYSSYPVLLSTGVHTYHFYASDKNDNLSLASQANRNLTFLPVSPAEVLTGPLVSVGTACLGPNCDFAALHPSDKNALSDPGWLLGMGTNRQDEWGTALDTNDGNTTLASSSTSGDDLYLEMENPDPGLNSFWIELVSATIVAMRTGNPASIGVGIVTTDGETPLISQAVDWTANTYLISRTLALWSVSPVGRRWTWNDITNAQVHINHSDADAVRITEAYLTVNVSPIGLSFSSLASYRTTGVYPSGGNTGAPTSFVYRVVYSNVNGLAPRLISVRIDGDTLGSLMSIETPAAPTAADYRFGVLYSLNTAYAQACTTANPSCKLFPALHSYFFEAQAPDVTGAVVKAVWPLGAALSSVGTQLPGPSVQRDANAPLLSFASQAGFLLDLESDSDGVTGRGVEPNRGLLTTLFSFKVVYYSPDNIPPSFVRLHVDNDALPGSPFTMTRDLLAAITAHRDGSYLNSEQFTTALLSFKDTPMTHTYYFEASDLASTLRLPATGNLFGPLVSDVLVSTVRIHPSGLCTTSGPTACPATTWTTPTAFATAMDTRDGTTGTTGTYARAAAPALGRRMFMEMDAPSFTNTTGLRIESVAVTAVARDSAAVSYEIGVCLSACATAAQQLWSTRGTRGGLNTLSFPATDCGVTNTPSTGCLTEIFGTRPGGGRWKVEDIANARALVSHRGVAGAATNNTMDVTELYLTVTFTNTLSLDFCTAAANCTETGYGADDGVDPNAISLLASNPIYKVVYSHGANIAPTLISVWIDGTLYSMRRDTPACGGGGGGLMRDCDYTNGELFSLMSVGMRTQLHSYYFQASIGTDLDSLPESGRLYGPGSTANTPTLASAWVEPLSQVTGASYSFRLRYTDLDNDPPQSLKVFIDGASGGVLLMSRDTTTTSNNSALLSNGRYDDGELFSVGLPMFRSLSNPQHTFYFTATDGGVEVRYPQDALLSFIAQPHAAHCDTGTKPKGVFCGPTVTDVSRPQPITDLVVYDHTLDTAALQWTAPGNDENSAAGFVSQYEIRFSTLRIVDDGRLHSLSACASKTQPDSNAPRDLKSIRPTEALFCHVADDPNRPPQTSYGGFSGVINASKTPPPPTPAEGGQTQTFTITNLNPNTVYYIAIRAEDQSGYLSSLVSVTVATRTSVVNSPLVGPGATSVVPPDPGTKLRTGFGMLSVPLAPIPSAVEAALGDRLGTPLQLFLWIPSGEASDAGGFSQVAEIKAGLGYFGQPLSESPSLLRATNDDDTAKGSPVSTVTCPGGMPGGNCFTIQLSSGWNPIGNPFAEEIRLDSTYLRSTWTGAGPLYSLASAVVAGWISGTLFEWVGDKYDQQTYNATDTVTGAPSGAARLRPWHGYFLQALHSGRNDLGSYDFIIRRP